ncbi:hypothetical protein MKQ70_30015 [Chitinophaga sedimenti]|uniref:hypothetical protein n=1 Tax=Chitinophaga sedimenti TaxID=2033606 RepID=UPI0020068809|nr:hypothetical protein [Chitinophaga sedimenti]MCK7558988.1 hypothetical protein [Chitinophaga sedimenti]
MVHYLHLHQIPHPPIYLVFGTRTEQDLLYAQEMRCLQQEMPGFTYLPTLSRDQNADWWGQRGYVHNVYEGLLADRRPASFYLCGWKAMIDEAKQRILAMGYDRKDIHRNSTVDSRCSRRCDAPFIFFLSILQIPLLPEFIPAVKCCVAGIFGYQGAGL